MVHSLKNHDINIIAKKQEIMYSSFVKNEYYFS